ncbi:MAG: hypothetical protein PQ612_02530 [Rickettsiales bacterium]|nr:hypothetical protein [Pseudomonadota bacterium]MDA0966011.1 hypothetical protein [Pseudomonadota bacterium]MDG4542518.1 hypothetical protein [Rickettsiales bacterium]MDG4545022.1 hypothetical protein [Rickettsiales bacterium]MDG4547145.1 hypothetical protein [Rickettsiales bacterium]
MDNENNRRRPEPESPQRNVRPRAEEPGTPEEQIRRGNPENPPPLPQRGVDRLVNIQPGQAPFLPDLDDGIDRGAGQAAQDIDRDTGANIVTPDRSGSHAAREQQRRDNDREQGR